MPWVRFVSDFEYKVRPAVLLVYRSGRRYLVKAECARRAIEEGKAVPGDGDGERSQELGPVLRQDGSDGPAT
jgi:hypothetical protein